MVVSDFVPQQAQVNNTCSEESVLVDKKPDFCLNGQPIPRRFSGFVKFFNAQKGYGFIIPTEDISHYYPSKKIPKEIFVHHSAIVTEGVGFKCLAEHELVEFELTLGPKGIQAGNVTGPKGAHVIGDPIYSNGLIAPLAYSMPHSPTYYHSSTTISNPDGFLLNGMLQGTNHSLAPVLYPTPPGFYPPGVISISPVVASQRSSTDSLSNSSGIIDTACNTRTNESTTTSDDISTVAV